MKDQDKTKEQLIKELKDLRKQLAGFQGRKPEQEALGAKEPKIRRPDIGAPGVAVDPWLPIETKLVSISVITGIVVLVVLAVLVNMFLLGGH